LKILVTGATGFTGSYVVPLLLEKGFSVRCLVRALSDKSRLPSDVVEWAVGDIADLQSLKRAMEGADILVNLASIGFGHAPNIIQAAVSSRVKRAVFISTTATFTTLNAPSKKIRLDAEAAIRKSPLAYTILRPTMIYGSSRDRNMSRLIRYLKRHRLIPIFGSGEYLQQPVYVQDVARAVVSSLHSEETIGKAYNIPGAEAVSYNRIIDKISRILGRKIQKIHLPAAPAVGALKMAEYVRLKLPLKSEQILRLNEDKAFSYEDAYRDFQYIPLKFDEGIGREIQEMQLEN